MTASSPPPDPALGPNDASGGEHGHGDHGDANCDEAVAELYAFLDGELDDTVMIQVETHLRRCSPCLEAFDFEADLRRVIAAKCTEQVTPEAKARLCAALHELSVRGAVSGPIDDPVAPTDRPGGAPVDGATGPGVPSPADGS